MEEQINQLKEMGVTLTPNMAYIAVFIALAIQFAKAVLSHWSMFEEDAIKQTLYPMLSAGVTMTTYYFLGVQDWALCGVVMGFGASGMYVAFSGTAKLAKKNGVATMAVVLMLCSVLIFGCNTFSNNPKAELLAAQKTFTATVNSLTVMHKAGKISDEEAAQLTVLIHQGQGYLIAWEDALKAGNPRPDVIPKFKAVLDKLLDYEIAKEGGD
jgi:hypothetical protein